MNAQPLKKNESHLLPHFAQSSIIVVENTASLSTILLEALKSAGFQNISIFQNGEEAWGCFIDKFGTKNQPKLFIADTKTLGVSGMDLLRAVRNFAPQQTGQIPFVLTSTHVTPNELKSAQLLEASEYIIKPYSVAELIKKVIRLLA